MYTVTDRLFSYIDSNCSRDFQQFEDYYSNFQEINASMSNPIQASGITEYDLGGEGDLFKAPEPIIEEPSMGLDPMTATISMISCGEGAITTQGLKVADLELIESEQLLNEVFYECKKDLMEKTGVETSLSDVLNVKLPNFTSDENIILKNEFNPDASLSKSVSSGCLSSTSWMQSVAAKPTFLEFSGVDFGSVYGMRRSFSEGDIKTLGNTGVANSPRGEPMLIGTCINEDRMEKLSRYRSKKSRRNFGRKIKYACRKALADNQPRIRGRFAKIEESDVSRSQ